MLRVTTIHACSAGASARYYTRYLAEDGLEADGVWAGRQADRLGLSGVVTTEDLELLLSGHDPSSGTRLGSALLDRVDSKGKVIKAVAGFDATFSAPKDLSVLWALTDDAGFLEAHDVAVTAVLAHLERFGATTRVRAKNGRRFPDTGGLSMAAFRQATSREDDPQLHTHVVISTKVQTADGRWLALDARYLKRKQAALGHLYQSVLRAELSHRYGVAWGPVVNGQAGILGMPQDLLEVFSKRSAQIDEELADKIVDFQQRNGRDPNRWERATLTREAAADTRENKTGETVANLGTRWQAEADALGWDAERLTTALRTAAREAPQIAPTTIGQVLEHLSAAGSTWTRVDVLGAVSDLASPVSPMSGHDWAQAVETATDQVLGSCITLDPPTDTPARSSDGRSIWLAPVEPNLTHETILAQEERILTYALDAQLRVGGPSASVDRDGLDVLQADTAAAVAGRDALVLVVGPAGTGKTTMLRRAATHLHNQHRPVFGVAPTAKAAKVLRDETGIGADTVAELLHEWRPTATRPPRDDYRLSAGSTLIVDEAGMLGTGNLDQLTQLAVSQRWRLVLVGDPRQLQAVGRGGMFDELCRVAPIHELAVIHRFRHRWEQHASLQLRAGDPTALDAYVDHGRVTAGSFADLAQRAASRWIGYTATGKTVALVAATNEHVDALNAAVQAERRRLGHLGRRDARIAGSETASVGDIVVTRRNDRDLRTDRGEPIRNRERWTVTAVSKDGELTLSHLQGHGGVRVPVEYAQHHLRLGYAATAHGHQGDTVDVSLAVVTRATSHRSLYVAATRGREDNQLLVVADEPTIEAARDVLDQTLSNDRADAPATAQDPCSDGAAAPRTRRRRRQRRPSPRPGTPAFRGDQAARRTVLATGSRRRTRAAGRGTCRVARQGRVRRDTSLARRARPTNTRHRPSHRIRRGRPARRRPRRGGTSPSRPRRRRGELAPRRDRSQPRTTHAQPRASRLRPRGARPRDRPRHRHRPLTRPLRR